jgi:phage baseplate assembly protein W
MRPRREYKINTLDINRNRGIGISVPFNPVNVFNVTYTTKDQVKSNLINFFLTNLGERYFNPEFGANLRKLIFDQMYNIEEVQSMISEKVRLYFPNLNVIDVIVTPDYDKNVFKIRLVYEINTQEDSITIQIV